MTSLDVQPSFDTKGEIERKREREREGPFCCNILIWPLLFHFSRAEGNQYIKIMIIEILISRTFILMIGM